MWFFIILQILISIKNNIFYQQRLDLESRIREALNKLDGDLAGTYKSLTEMSYDERNALIEEHILYNDADDKY